MPGKTPRVTPLELRKQLLIAESEINRAELLRQGQMLVDGISDLVRKASSFSMIAPSIASLVGVVAASTTGTSAAADSKASWLQKGIRTARLAFQIWLVFRSFGSGSKGR